MHRTNAKGPSTLSQRMLAAGRHSSRNFQANQHPACTPIAGYCTIATVLAALYKPAADVVYEPLVGQSPMERVFSIFNALSTMMFAVS